MSNPRHSRTVPRFMDGSNRSKRWFPFVCRPTLWMVELVKDGVRLFAVRIEEALLACPVWHALSIVRMW
eukprot:scaffold2058_cov115-Cylindrotheca_fusiformis.AAC.15